MKEQALLHRIMLACSRGTTRLFRNNVGVAWIGKSIRFSRVQTIGVSAGDVLIHNARPFHSGFKGMGDLLGWNMI